MAHGIAETVDLDELEALARESSIDAGMLKYANKLHTVAPMLIAELRARREAMAEKEKPAPRSASRGRLKASKNDK